MAHEPSPFAIRFRRPGETRAPTPRPSSPAIRAAPAAAVPGPQRSVYELALDLTASVHTIMELAATERFRLKDKLDRQVTGMAIELARAGNMALVSDRRQAYGRARQTAEECAAILDIFGRRATVEPELLDPTRAQVAYLIRRLAALGTW